MSSNRPAWKRLLIETMTAASELISEDIRKDFLVIGGAALARYGSPRNTQDVDIAITPQTLGVFWDRAESDPRFSMHPDGRWVYTCQGTGVKGVAVEIEFLRIGGEFVPKLRGMTKFDSIWIASLPDIAIMKARSEEHTSELQSP